MDNKGAYAEKNIEKLISSSFKKENRPDVQHKEIVLGLLQQKAAKQKRDFQPDPLNIIGISVIWAVISVLLFSEFKDPIYIVDFMKLLTGLGLLMVPVSSIVLIILKLKTYDKKVV